LDGCDAHLSVISGRAVHLARMQHLRAQLGADPAAWLPAYLNPAPAE
jgi:type IV secretory pathway VirB4 component